MFRPILGLKPVLGFKPRFQTLVSAKDKLTPIVFLCFRELSQLRSCLMGGMEVKHLVMRLASEMQQCMQSLLFNSTHLKYLSAWSIKTVCILNVQLMKNTLRWPKTNLVHSRAVRKKLVAIILSIPIKIQRSP